MEKRSGPDLREGDHVHLGTRDPMVVYFGRGKNPIDLDMSELYEIVEVEPHTNHTLIWVKNEGGKVFGPFNEALFEHYP